MENFVYASRFSQNNENQAFVENIFEKLQRNYVGWNVAAFNIIT